MLIEATMDIVKVKASLYPQYKKKKNEYGDYDE